LSLLDVSDRIRRRALTSEEVTRLLLSRIENVDRQLHSFRLVLSQEALEQARLADKEIASGFWRGPLHGVPIGIKDLLHMKGHATTAGMDLVEANAREEDATIVERLKQAGAVLIGKLHMTEGALFEHHSAFPRPVNPWSAAHHPGLSSSGSGIAVAAGLCFGAIGTDTGGSIRMPCAANGISGIKPTWGRVSRHGYVPLAESFDHIGPMARTAADCAAILQAIAGWDPQDPTTLSEPVPDYSSNAGCGLGDLVIGLDRSFATDDTSDEISQNFDAMLDIFTSLGARFRKIAFPPIADTVRAAGQLIAAEAAFYHDNQPPAQKARYGTVLRNRIESVSGLDAKTVAHAYQMRNRFNGMLNSVFRDVDLIMLPAVPEVTHTWAEFDRLQNDRPSLQRRLLRFTTPANIAGIPTMSLPTGLSKAGLPLGIQLLAKRLGEPLLCAAGNAFQKATPFHTLRPPIA
jgi:amidase